MHVCINGGENNADQIIIPKNSLMLSKRRLITKNEYKFFALLIGDSEFAMPITAKEYYRLASVLGIRTDEGLITTKQDQTILY